MSEKKNLLPPGWECKYDENNGKCYYINHITKALQLQDPRPGYVQLKNDSIESIPLQPMHGSPYHVYPVNNFTAVKAFQGPHSSIQSISGSPLMSTLSQTTMETPLLRTYDSPNIRLDNFGNNRRKSIPMQETSFTNQIDTNSVVSKIQTMFPTAGENHIRLLLKKYYNSESVVISALQVEKHPLCTPGPFTTPPVQRHLFNQNNSAFQMTPPTRRLDYFSRSGSPMPNSATFRPSSIKNGFVGHLYGSPKFGEQIRNSPKPHSSPKMKLRYMKNIFPKADETLLLDVLANSDNNVQKASERLITMGYTKREVQILPNPQKIENQIIAAEIIPLRPKELSDEEKETIKIHLQEKYPKITERIVSMALESVGYSEDRAIQILQIVQQEDDDRAKKEAASQENKVMDKAMVKGNIAIKESSKEPIIIGKDQNESQEKLNSLNNEISYSNSKNDIININYEETTEVDNKSSNDITYVTENENQQNQLENTTSSSSISTVSTSFFSSKAKGSKYIIKYRTRDKSGSLKNSSSSSNDTEKEAIYQNDFQSMLGKISTLGHNKEFVKGANESLLLADYVTWSGPNPNISVMNRVKTKGADTNNLKNDRVSTHGSNSDLCKGPQNGLAKGSIYATLNANIKCN